MKRESIFQIEFRKKIADVSEETLVQAAKKIVIDYEDGFKRMKRHQIESLGNIAMSISDIIKPEKSIFPFIANQTAKNKKEKPEKYSWYYQSEKNPIPLGEKLQKILSNQKSVGENLAKSLEDDFKDILADSKTKKKMSEIASNQLIKDFIIYLINWYNNLEILGTLQEV